MLRSAFEHSWTLLCFSAIILIFFKFDRLYGKHLIDTTMFYDEIHKGYYTNLMYDFFLPIYWHSACHFFFQIMSNIFIKNIQFCQYWQLNELVAKLRITRLLKAALYASRQRIWHLTWKNVMIPQGPSTDLLLHFCLTVQQVEKQILVIYTTTFEHSTRKNSLFVESSCKHLNSNCSLLLFF